MRDKVLLGRRDCGEPKNVRAFFASKLLILAPGQSLCPCTGLLSLAHSAPTLERASQAQAAQTGVPEFQEPLCNSGWHPLPTRAPWFAMGAFNFFEGPVSLTSHKSKSCGRVSSRPDDCRRADAIIQRIFGLHLCGQDRFAVALLGVEGYSMRAFRLFFSKCANAAQAGNLLDLYVDHRQNGLHHPCCVCQTLLS